MGSALQFPPAGLSRAEAASHVGLGITLFDRLVSDGRMPRPRRIDGRLVWVRAEVERALNDLPYDGSPANTSFGGENSFDALLARRQREGSA